MDDDTTSSIQVVTPVYGEFVPEVARGRGGQILTSVYNASANSIVPGSAPAIASDVNNGKDNNFPNCKIACQEKSTPW